MGRSTFTRSTYRAATAGMPERHVTKRAEQKAAETGKLEPLVDPSGFGVIRLSLPRVEDKGGRFELTVGTPIPVETRVDTTGSMGHNVDVALKVLPDAFEYWTKVLAGYDLQVATGIFGDVCDRFPLCRPQFEMVADKIVRQLTLMVPEKGGGDTPEDPDIGIFGGAYLCRHYINRIGLKGYDFTVTDAPGRGRIAEDQLKRVFGDEVFDKVKENDFRHNQHGQYELGDVWSGLLDRAHAFVLQVGPAHDASRFWSEHVGKERLVALPDTKYLPHVQAVIIGLTEGSLLLPNVVDFLTETNMDEDTANRVAESVADIPIGAQAQLPNFSKRPAKGDLFAGKPDVWADKYLWPEEGAADAEEADADTEEVEAAADGDGDDWV